MPRDSLGLPGYAVIGSENAINKRLLFLGGDHHHKLSTQFKNFFFFNLFPLISSYLVISPILLKVFQKRNCSTFSEKFSQHAYKVSYYTSSCLKTAPPMNQNNLICIFSMLFKQVDILCINQF